MSLLRELERVRARLRWSVLLRGVVLWCGSLLIGLLLIGSIDWFWQPENHVARWGMLIVLLIGVLVAGWYFVLRRWARTLSITDVALQLERTDPSWRGQLAAAAALKSEPEQHSTRGRIDIQRPLWRLKLWPFVSAAMPLCLGLCCLLMLWGMQPHLLQIGLARTLLPAEPIRWPRHTELQMVTESGQSLSPGRPWRVDARQPITVYVADREGLPPSEVELQLKFPTGHVESHTLQPLTRSASQSAAGDFQFSWLPASGITWVRVRGGDDETVSWCPIEAVTAPVITQTDVTLTFPKYLNLPERELTSLPAKLSVPAGTTMRLRGTLDRPVQELLFRTTSGTTRRVVLDDAGDTFIWEETIAAGPPRIFWFEPIDESGLAAARPPRHELIPIDDTLPEVHVQVPEQDLFIAPNARVPWELRLRDDDRIASAELVMTVNDEPPRTIWSGTWSDDDDAPSTIRGWLDFQTDSALPTDDSQSVPATNTVNLSPLPAGAEVRLAVRARDSHPGEDRWASSPLRVLRIVTDAEKLHELEQRVAAQSKTLTEQWDLLIRHQQLLRDLRQRAEQREKVSPDDVRPLLACRQWLDTITEVIGDVRGVRYQLQHIVRESELNRLPPADLAEPLRLIDLQLDQLQQRELATFSETFTVLVPAMESLRPSGDSDEWAPPSTSELIRAELAGASLQQGWNELLMQLARWSRQLDFREQFDELYAAGKSSREVSLALAQRTLARPAGTLSDDERAELAQLVQQYQQLAVDADQLQQPLTVEQQTSPLILSAHRRWKSAEAATQFHHIAQSLQRNSMGQALQGQAEVQSVLNEIRDLLHDRSPDEEDLLFEKVGEQRAQVESLLAREQQLLQALAAATLSEDAQSRAELDRLLKESEDLLLASQQLRRRLRAMQLETPTRPLDAAADHLQATRLHLGARERAAAIQRLEQARERTAAVIKALQELEQQFAEDALQQHMASFSQSCAELAARQARLTAETVRLRDVKEAEGRWTRGQLQTLLETSTLQNKLADELVELRLLVTDLSLVQIVTDDLAKEMRICSANLRERNVSTDTEQRQRKVEGALMTLAETLLTPANNTRTNASTSAGQAADQSNASQLSSAKAGELRLLLALQSDLNRRTREVAESGSTPESSELRRLLLDEQRRLATWLKALLAEDSTPIDGPRNSPLK